MAFTLRGPDGVLGPLTVGVPGLHNARNAAVAAVAALQAGAPFAAAQARAGPLRRCDPPLRVPGRGQRGAPSWTTTPTCPPRSGPRWPRPEAAGGPGWSPCSSRTATPAPRRWPSSSARPFSTPTRWWSPTSTAPASARCRACRGAWWPTPCGRRTRVCPVTYVAGWEELRRAVAGLLRPGDLCLTLGAGDLTTLPDELLGCPGGDGRAALDALAAHLGPRADDRNSRSAPLTTYGVGGPAALFVEVRRPDDLACRACRAASRMPRPRSFVIGRGSNLLVSDAGFDGVAVQLGAGSRSASCPTRADGDGPSWCGPAPRAAAHRGPPGGRRRAGRAWPGPWGCPDRWAAPCG